MNDTKVQLTGSETVVDLAWAKRSCRHCYGTGILGTRIGKKDGRATREQIVCTCVAKEAIRRLREAKAKEAQP